MRAAAIQIEPDIGNIAHNIESCRKLAVQAAKAGAEWVLLPEFFTTGMGFLPELGERALPPDGEATRMMQDVAHTHGVHIGGSFLCLDGDGETHNAFFLVAPSGIVGRHDKDIPSCWENCFYVGGSDDGVMQVGDLSVGAALCLEFNRSATARRLARRVDLVIGGNYKWGAPRGRPFYASVTRAHARWMDWAPRFAAMVGAPVIEASQCGRLVSKTPWAPGAWDTDICGCAIICDASGNVLARRDYTEGPGIVVADVQPGRVEPALAIPDRFWIGQPDFLTRVTWHIQKWHGQRWYRAHVSKASRTKLLAAPAANIEAR
jgi:predicted amidohydrolase